MSDSEADSGPQVAGSGALGQLDRHRVDDWTIFCLLRLRSLRQCWTGLLVVSGHRCFYVCGFNGDDLCGLEEQ